MSNKFWDFLAPGRKPRPPKPPPEPVDPAPIEPPPAPAGPLPRGQLVRIPGPFHPRLYSYWANARVGSDNTVYVFGGHLHEGPTLYQIRDAVIDRKMVLPGSGTTESWYWDARLARIYQPIGPRLTLLDPFSGNIDIVMDILDRFPNCRVFQTHSSDDGHVHSATVQTLDSWQFKTTVVQTPEKLHEYRPKLRIDESQITPDGKYLIIKEVDPEAGALYNRIIKLNEWEYELAPQECVGHSDNGNGFIIGEDSNIGAAVRFDLETRERKRIFDSWNMGHVSIRGSRALFSRHESGRLELWNLDTMAKEYEYMHGVVSNDYDLQVRANLSPCGRVAAFTMNEDLWILGL